MKRRKLLVACEYSGTVRDAFSARGWDAMSCDLLPSESAGNHYQGDVRDLFGEHFDLVIAHPPCTHLSVSGARWFKHKAKEQSEAIEFFMLMANWPCQRVAVENPVCIMSSKFRKPDQIIQPWQFGHGETKATCLWLRGLPKLKATQVVEGREQRIWKMPPGPERWKERSRTFPGIANAMADQWAAVIESNLRT